MSVCSCAAGGIYLKILTSNYPSGASLGSFPQLEDGCVNYQLCSSYKQTKEELRERELKKKVKELIKCLSASRLCSSLLFGLLNSALVNFVSWNAVHNNEIQLQLNEGDPTKQHMEHNESVDLSHTVSQKSNLF